MENSEQVPDVKAAEGPRKRKRSSNKSRYTVFVGNLPYTATADSIRLHFESVVAPTHVRCLNLHGQPDKCRGTAFVDLPDATQQYKCLDELHRSIFKDGKSSPRQINIELSAGGGGRAALRQQKIKAANDKLNQNRSRRSAKIATRQKKQQQQQVSSTVGRDSDKTAGHKAPSGSATVRKGNR